MWQSAVHRGGGVDHLHGYEVHNGTSPQGRKLYSYVQLFIRSSQPSKCPKSFYIHCINDILYILKTIE